MFALYCRMFSLCDYLTIFLQLNIWWYFNPNSSIIIITYLKYLLTPKNLLEDMQSSNWQCSEQVNKWRYKHVEVFLFSKHIFRTVSKHHVHICIFNVHIYFTSRVVHNNIIVFSFLYKYNNLTQFFHVL